MSKRRKRFPINREAYDILMAGAKGDDAPSQAAVRAGFKYAVRHGDDAQIRTAALAYFMVRRRQVAASGRDVAAWASQPAAESGFAAVCCAANAYAAARVRNGDVDAALAALLDSVTAYRSWLKTLRARPVEHPRDAAA